MNISTIVEWANAHPRIIAAIVLALGYLLLNWKVARTAIEKRAGSKLLAGLDLIAVAGMKGASSRLNAPGVPSKPITTELGDIVRDTIVPAIVAANAPAEPPPAPPAPADPAPASDVPRGSSAGFVTGPVLRAIAALAFAALCIVGPMLSLTGCPGMPSVDGCTVGAVRCSERGVPQTCDVGKRWTPMDDQCSAHGAQCCVTAAYSSRTIAVCLPMSEACHVAQ